MSKIWNKDEILKRIAETLPEGGVVPRHNERGHFYEVIGPPFLIPPIYPSVTGKLSILKDEGLINYKMNRAIESLKNYMFGLGSLPDMTQIDGACDVASRVSQDILHEAGDIGTRVHNCREVIFKQWRDTGVRPVGFPDFITEAEYDIRVVSCLRALESFCIDWNYTPIATELLVYNHDYGVAGTLDDLGMMKQVVRAGDGGCDHIGLANASMLDPMVKGTNGKTTCMHCGYQTREQFVLMDLKTSNQFKDHYFFQVAIYWWMLWVIMGKEWKPERCVILKLSKEDGSYKLEDLLQPAKLAMYARAMLKTNEGMEFIKALRKNNLKTVLKI